MNSKKEIIVLAVLVIALAAFWVISVLRSNSSETNLSPREDPASKRFQEGVR